jgi:hypothetical protein
MLDFFLTGASVSNNLTAVPQRVPRSRVSLTMRSLPVALPGKYGSILIDPPWRFANRTGKMAPEHRRLYRYPTISFEENRSLAGRSDSG